MTAQPVWLTTAGNLGTVPEGVFYTSTFQTYQANALPVMYRVVAGDLPPGMELTTAGILEGVPVAAIPEGSEAVQVGRNVTSKFAVRAYTTKIVAGRPVVDRIADRTFSITITSQNYPQWITAPGEIAELLDGTLLAPGIQLQYTNDNISGIPDVSLVTGQLPPGLTLSDTGLISGVVIPNPGTNAIAGYSIDGQGYSQYPYDFPQTSISYNYEFTLQVTDGKTAALRTFSIFVVSTNIFNASTTEITADNDLIKASVSSVPAPLILNPQGSIGSYRNDNFFAYQFIATDVNGDQLNFTGVDIPPGLTLDPITGWLYGYIPNLGLTELTFDFTVYAFSTVTAGLISDPYNYSVTFIGPISTNITWITPSDLGTIANGTLSKLSVEAVSTFGLTIQYQLAAGTDSELPQGLTLLPSGEIVGCVSFDTFALDGGKTYFDNHTTTFDSTFTFTVNAYSLNGYISVFKTFTIRVVREFNEPFNILYIQCMPPLDDRIAISGLLQDRSVFPPDLLYRYDDPNFGLSDKIAYRHAFGLRAGTLDEYVQSLTLNHYWKNLVLGPIKTAQALDQLTGEVIYEVVYSDIIDNLVNNDGVSVGKEVVLAYPIDPNTLDEIDVVYPNALENMRDQVIDVVGQLSKVLPEWMLTKQSDGNVLGFRQSWVIAYTKPGASGQIAYNIQQKFGNNLNLIDFKADRYEIDTGASIDWDPYVTTLVITGGTGNGTATTLTYNPQLGAPFSIGDAVKIENATPTAFNGTFFVTACSTTQVVFNSPTVDTWVAGGTVSSVPHWIPSPPTTTTFDIQYHYALVVNDHGNGYAPGDVLTILGSELGGLDGVNDLTIEVRQVDNVGDITYIFFTGVASILANGDTFASVSASSQTGTGTGMTWDITVIPGVQTVFDYDSLQFNAPSTINTNSDAQNKYIMFPKRNILK